jgi:peptidylprolyl isomerase
VPRSDRRSAFALLLVALFALALVSAACGGDDDSASSASSTTPSSGATASKAAVCKETGATKPTVQVPANPATKLEVTDIKPGSGPAAKAGDTITVQYVGVSQSNRQQFDASWDRGQPFSFQLGTGNVIPGWDQGLVGLKLCGRRQLVIPPALGYGAQGQGPIGPNETLVFVVDLLQIG